MEWFESQKALLEYLWKNPEDRKWIKRRMEEGLIWKEDWMFYISDKIDWINYKGSPKGKKEEKSELEEVKVDNEELDELKKKNEQLMEAYKSVVTKYNNVVDAYKKEKEKADEQWGLYNHLVYFYLKFKDWKKFVDWKVFWQTEHNKSERWTQDTMETVRPDVYERYKFTYWEVEEAECEAVEKIIAKRAEELAEIPF